MAIFSVKNMSVKAFLSCVEPAYVEYFDYAVQKFESPLTDRAESIGLIVLMII